jgi:chromate transporter
VTQQVEAHGVSFKAALKVWAYIGLNSFGGPAGQIAVMHREIVDRHRWVSDRRFLHALNYCMVLPGPEAQQLATYLGWLMHGVWGGVAAGSLFIVPGFIAMLALSMVYAVWGSVALVAGLLAGLQAAVVVLVVQAFIRISKRTLKSTFLKVVAACSFIGIFVFEIPFPMVIIAAGLMGYFKARTGNAILEDILEQADSEDPLLRDDVNVTKQQARSALSAAVIFALLWVIPVVVIVAVFGMSNVFAQEALFFSKAAVVTFGGAYAVLGYVAQEAVGRYGWLSTADMATGLGLAETTPGPLILVVQFVGFLGAYNNPGNLSPLLAGTLGALVTVWVTFIPCFFFIFLGAPFAERLRENQRLSGALTAIGAAVAGVILNLALWFGLNTMFTTVSMESWGLLHVSVPELMSINWSALGIAAVAAVLIFRCGWPTLRVLAVCALLGALVAYV